LLPKSMRVCDEFRARKEVSAVEVSLLANGSATCPVSEPSADVFLRLCH